MILIRLLTQTVFLALGQIWLLGKRHDAKKDSAEPPHSVYRTAMRMLRSALLCFATQVEESLLRGRHSRCWRVSSVQPRFCFEVTSVPMLPGLDAKFGLRTQAARSKSRWRTR